MEGEWITYTELLQMSSPAPTELYVVRARWEAMLDTGARLGITREGSLKLTEGRGRLGRLWNSLNSLYNW